jgi:hypothetical protein
MGDMFSTGVCGADVQDKNAIKTNIAMADGILNQ